MNSIATAAIIMGGLGLLFGVVLALAYRLLKVEEDPRVVKVERMLPGSNCGACGEPGCRGFAEKVVAGEHPPRRCSVADDQTVQDIAEAVGVAAGDDVKVVARLACAGGKSQARQIAEYKGYANCRAAAAVGGGGKECQWGCLGLADCQVACTFDAITMNAERLPAVDPDLCTACGDCVEACPRGLFELIPLDQKLYVQCKAQLSGEEAHAVCSVACDACGRCVQDAPPGLIRMENNLPVVDYSAGGPATPNAVLRCPTGAIQWLKGAQFADSRYRVAPGETTSCEEEGHHQHA